MCFFKNTNLYIWLPSETVALQKLLFCLNKRHFSYRIKSSFPVISRQQVPIPSLFNINRLEMKELEENFFSASERESETEVAKHCHLQLHKMQLQFRRPKAPHDGKIKKAYKTQMNSEAARCCKAN